MNAKVSWGTVSTCNVITASNQLAFKCKHLSEAQQGCDVTAQELVAKVCPALTKVLRIMQV